MKKAAARRCRGVHSGVTLIELLISLALSLAVLIGLSSVYVAVKQSFRFQENTGRLQEDANFALDTISRELRMAGFAGCPGIRTTTIGSPAVTTRFPGSVLASGSPGSPSGLHGPNPLAVVESLSPEVTVQPFTPVNFVRGFDNVPSAMFSSGAPVSNGSHSLFFAGGGVDSVGISTLMTTPSSALTIASDVYNWAAGDPYYMIVSDCVSSSLFEGTVSTSGGVTTIAHDGAGNAGTAFTSSRQFGTDAIVTLAQWNFFYIATRAGAAAPSLYRVSFNGATRSAQEETVPNVESMRLHYGENTAAVAGVNTLEADVWRTSAAAVTDWSRVVAVRVGLMMVSAEDSVNPGVTLAVPTLLGQSYTAPSGASANRLRKEFSTTVVLRNSVSARR